MEQYVHLCLEKPSAVFILPVNLSIKGEGEVALTVCVMPKQILNLGRDEVIKRLYYKAFRRKFIKFVKEDNLDEKLNQLFQSAGYKNSSIHYLSDQFEVMLEDKYIMKLSKRLQSLLGLPKRIQGKIKGKPVERKYTNLLHHNDYLYFFSAKPKKLHIGQELAFTKQQVNLEQRLRTFSLQKMDE